MNKLYFTLVSLLFLNGTLFCSASGVCAIPSVNMVKYKNVNNGVAVSAVKVVTTESDLASSLRCSAYIKGLGWQKNVKGNEIFGDKHKHTNIEAIKIKLVGKSADEYDVCYRTLLCGRGLLGWARNGDIAGSVGMNSSVLDAEIRLIRKGDFLDNVHCVSAIINAHKNKISYLQQGMSGTSVIKIDNKFFKGSSPYPKEIRKLLGVKNTEDLSIRNVASTRIADLLCVSDLIARSQYVSLKNESYINGILMDDACGIHWPFGSIREGVITPSIQKSLSSLLLLDGICDQIDRVPWNYAVKVSSVKRATSVVGFDNDLSFGSSNTVDCRKGWRPAIVRDGKITLPHITKKLGLRILEITDEMVYNSLCDLLEPVYISATQNRVRQIKEAISKSIAADGEFLLCDNEWNNATLNEEISVKKSNSYLNFLIDRLK